MDRVYVRKFISGVLLHCAPPYKVEFAMPLLELILKCKSSPLYYCVIVLNVV